MEKAKMLAKNIHDFIKYVGKSHKNSNSIGLNTDKLYQIKLWIEEFKFQIIADELLRINKFEWDEKYTYLLVDRFKKGFNIIDEYVKNNYNDLFIISARLYTLKNLCLSLNKLEPNTP
jgi:hypothetical protein